jgi:hypothetical protein
MDILHKVYYFLKETNPDLAARFKKMAMAIPRDMAIAEINAQGTPFCLHAILYSIMKQNSINPPKTWMHEMFIFLENIDSKNIKRKGKWFTSKEIQTRIDHGIKGLKKRLIRKISDGYPKRIQNVVIKTLDQIDFFEVKLSDFGIRLQYNDQDDLIAVFTKEK